MGGCTTKHATTRTVPQNDAEEHEAESDVDSGSDCEVFKEVPLFTRRRGYACSVEAHGAWNKQRPFKRIAHDKTPIQKRTIKASLRQCEALEPLSKSDLDILADATSIISIQADQSVFLRGEYGEAVYVVLLGCVDIFAGIKDPFSNDNVPLATFSKGDLLGSSCMVFNFPRTVSAYGGEGGMSVLGRLDRDFFVGLLVDRQKEWRNERMQLLRGSQLLESLRDDQIGQLAEVLEVRVFDEGDPIITQGQRGDEFFIMQAGEAVVEVETGLFSADVQEHRRYTRGDLFGERALLSGQPRAASIIACNRCETLVLSRKKFERLLGPLSLLQGGLYLADPRKIIADFYSNGDHNGPHGALQLQNHVKGWLTTMWFAVYRPTSRDAIAKMLAGVAVGKGLNVKGKSAKKGVLSGYVPFIQISKNEHKVKVEKPDLEARLKIFYRNPDCREQVLRIFRTILEEKDNLGIADASLNLIDDWNEGKYAVWGIDIPEALMHEAYIMMQDLEPIVGWETGRDSEPAFMDMNLHAIRAVSEPRVVMLQYDTEDPMNPRGLLVAYAEKYVKPVVSDFDTFTIGSKNMLYKPLPPDQLELANWALDRAEEVLSEPGTKGWNSRWLQVLARENAKGFHPAFPKYGFGDATSYDLVGQVVEATLSCGAIRHGAECFNFYFPQELDDEYLVVWDKFPDLPWAYKTQTELLEWLIARVEEGYSFPINPVWPIRDKGWYALAEALRKNSESLEVMKSWWVPSSGLLERIEAIHKRFPDCFSVLKEKPLEDKPPEKVPEQQERQSPPKANGKMKKVRSRSEDDPSDPATPRRKANSRKTRFSIPTSVPAVAEENAPANGYSNGPVHAKSRKSAPERTLSVVPGGGGFDTSAPPKRKSHGGDGARKERVFEEQAWKVGDETDVSVPATVMRGPANGIVTTKKASYSLRL